jgi:hypothetical protein
MVVKSVRIYITITPPQITSFTATQNPVPRGQMAQLNWTATSSEYCVGSGGWSGSKNRVLGSESVGPINTPMTFTLTCTSVTGSDGIGGIVIKNLQVDPYDPPPDITIGVSPNPITPVATDFSTLSWTVSKDTSCNAYANGVYMSSHTYGNAGGSHNESVSPDITTTYMLTCAGLGGTTTKSVTLTVSEIAPIISISASDNTIIEDDSTMLTWSVLGATSCVASGGSDGWDALSSADLLAGGPKSVTPSADTTYTLTCIGPWGEHTLPVTVYVLPKAQITNFELCTVGVGAVCMRPSDTTELTPWTINPGTPLEIDWEANPSTATFCSAIDGNGFITSSAIAGTQNLNATALPNVADEYTIACGTAGLLTNSATIYIATNPVAPDITISPRILPPGGGELKVSWDTNNGDQSVCSVNGGGLSGLLPSTGTDVGEATLSIYGRTTFTVTCGSETDSVTVELSPTLWES